MTNTTTDYRIECRECGQEYVTQHDPERCAVCGSRSITAHTCEPGKPLPWRPTVPAVCERCPHFESGPDFTDCAIGLLPSECEDPNSITLDPIDPVAFERDNHCEPGAKHEPRMPDEQHEPGCDLFVGRSLCSCSPYSRD